MIEGIGAVTLATHDMARPVRFRFTPCIGKLLAWCSSRFAGLGSMLERFSRQGDFH